MGIIIRQTGLSSFYSYLGQFIGFVNFAILMNRWFSSDELGLRSILLNISLIFIQIAHLGTFRSLVKFFPFFNQKDKYDNGLLSIGLGISLIGFLILSSVLIIFEQPIIASFQEDSNLFEAYYWLIFPMSFFLLYTRVFESYLQARSRIVLSSFLKNVFSRLVVTALLIMFFVDIIDFHWFIILFSFVNALSIIVFIFYLIHNAEFTLKLKEGFFNKRLKRVYFNFSGFSIVSNISAGLINKIDIVMIGLYLNLTDVAIYSNALFISAFINVPAQSLNQIALPLLSMSWKEKAIDQMELIYRKSSLNMLIAGGLLFILIICSIDNLFEIQKEVYRQGKMVFIILGLTKVFNMAFGINSQIIKISRYFRLDTILALILTIVTIITNILLIPTFGIEGAALATALSIVVFNLIRYVFVYKKLAIQPFSLQTVLTLFILIVALGIGLTLPKLPNIYLDTVYRSILIVLITVVPIYFAKVSEDINSIIHSILFRLGLK